MPRVKLDYVVSFSSEDPENPANNLLAWEVNKKKWLGSKGEPSCSVVLQLTKATQINAVHIGAYHAALVEVLVGLSEKPNDQYQVLVPSSVFLSPMDSRRGEGMERVRSFSVDQLSADTRDKKWDRIRVVCSQPYNKHCKYGLSFIQIYEPEGKTSDKPEQKTASAVPNRMLNLDTFSSDEDEFKPGELFAKHKTTDNSGSTEAQIRQATSHALKNIPDSSTSLNKTPITKASNKRKNPDDKCPDKQADRKRESLMYTDDDEQPNAKIDRIVNKHKDEKAKKDLDKKKDDDTKQKKDKPNIQNTPDTTKIKAKTPQSEKKNRDSDASSSRESNKRGHSAEKPKTKPLSAGPVSSSPHALLRGVVFALSGYENPRRAAVRDAALAMGARYERDWGKTCTHLICAFPNTPKLRAVRASPNGGGAAVATAEWVERCCARRRRLPWQWFATEPALRQPETRLDASDEDEEPPQTNKRRRTSSDDGSRTGRRNKDTERTNRSSPEASEADEAARSEADRSSDSVTFVRDERVRGSVTIDDTDSEGDTEDDGETYEPERVDAGRSLADFFEGYTFTVLGDAGQIDPATLRRYVTAYGGVFVEPSQLDEDSYIDYWLCANKPETTMDKTCVRADWVWRCHETKRLCPLAEYKL